mgnify:CR=1 FL=1|jgi:Ca2+-binding EF-hand superfamily protein
MAAVSTSSRAAPGKYAIRGAPAPGAADTTSSAARRQSCMTRVWCITNYCCLGRMYGRSLLHSSKVRADHPLHNDPIAAAYLPMFSRMSLSIRAIETLFEIFQLIDADGSGDVDMDEFLYFFRLHKSRFARRAFDIIDADKSGEIDFGEFVLGLYNFCTHDNLSLCRFAFDIYDEDGSGFLDHDEVEVIVKELYGRRAYKKNAQAQKTMRQIEALEWSANDSVGAAWQIDFPRFSQFCRSHPSLLYPAFLMQTTLQTRVLGTGFWTIASETRRRLENVLGCDNNLIDKLQRMHEEDQMELQRGGSRGGAAAGMVEGEFEGGPVGGGEREDEEQEEDEAWGEQGEGGRLMHAPAADEETAVGSANEESTSATLKTPQRRDRPAALIGLNEGGDGAAFRRQPSPMASLKRERRNSGRLLSPNRRRASGGGLVSPKASSTSARIREGKAEKKALLKEQYKREMRASRRAEAKGKDAKKAAKRAKEKFTAEKKKEAARKVAAKPTLQAKKKAIAAKDAGAAWKCTRCRHANFATSVCQTCKTERGVTASVMPLPRSPKARGTQLRLRRGNTIA